MTITLLAESIASSEKFSYNYTAKVSSHDLISTLVESQVPNFVADNNEKFLTFMKAYYEFLESKDKPYYDVKRLSEYQDIDKTIDQFAEQLKKEFLANFPKTEANLALILKNIKQFYTSKGTENSYKFLLRVLFDKPTEFYYPRTDVFRMSDAKFIIQKSLKVYVKSGNPFSLIGKRIIGKTSNATAYVENVQLGNFSPREHYEIFLNSKTINGKFEVLEELSLENDVDNLVVCEVLPVLVGITINNAGENYTTDDKIFVHNSIAKVKSVTKTGGIKSVEIINSGIDFDLEASYPLTFSSSTATSPATGIAIIDSTVTYSGYLLDENSQASTTKYLQDGHYYQQFSYVILIDESIDKYRDIVKKILHPAGLALYGSLRSQDLLRLKIKTPNNEVNSDSSMNLKLSLFSSKYLLRNSHEAVISRNAYIKSETSNLGPTVLSLDKNKLFYLPTDLTADNLTMTDENANYYGFPDLTPELFVGDGSANQILLSNEITSTKDLYIFSNATKTVITDFSMINSTNIQLNFIPVENENIYIYYLKQNIANAQIDNLNKTLNGQSILDKPSYTKINILPETVLKNV